MAAKQRLTYIHNDDVRDAVQAAGRIAAELTAARGTIRRLRCILRPRPDESLAEAAQRLRRALRAIRDQDEPQHPTGTWAAEIAREALR